MCAEGADGGSHGWEGPTPRRTGAGSSGQVFRAYTEATFSCVGTRLGGCAGRQGTPLSNGRRASWQKGQEPRLSPTPHDPSPSVSLSTGSRGQESQEREASPCGAKGRGAEGLAPSNLKVQEITAFGGAPEERKASGPACLGQAQCEAGSFPPSRSQRGTEAPRASLPRRHPEPSEGLDFLGFSANLVIVVNTDGDKEETAGQEQQDPQGHETCLR